MVGGLVNTSITTLEKLRTKYLEKVIRPAMRKYLNNDELKPTAIELLYNDALKFDGLLEVIHFLKKVEPVV